MTIAQIIYEHSLRLPDSAAYEVLVFIQMLEQRLNHTEAFLCAVAGTLNDDFLDDITDADLGNDATREVLD